MVYRFPKNAPKPMRESLRKTLSDLHSIIGNNLVGIYLYGSLAMECFQPNSSDVDLIFVTKDRLRREDSKRIIEYLRRTCSKSNRIELSMIALDLVQNPRYPMLVDLHYEYWENTFTNEEDHEILSNLYTTRKRGFCVWGTPIIDVFSKIPAQYHLRSVMEDIKHTRKYLHESPAHIGYNVTVYWVLSSCRILAFIREGKVLSKLEGGKWGLQNLPREHCNIIKQALSLYQRKAKRDSVWDHKELDTFADYMTDAIVRESRLEEQKQIGSPMDSA